jgi:hypothetical protein
LSTIQHLLVSCQACNGREKQQGYEIKKVLTVLEAGICELLVERCRMHGAIVRTMKTQHDLAFNVKSTVAIGSKLKQLYDGYI